MEEAADGLALAVPVDLTELDLVVLVPVAEADLVPVAVGRAVADSVTVELKWRWPVEVASGTPTEMPTEMSAPESAEAVLAARLAALQTLADAAMGAAETEPTRKAAKQRMVARQSMKGEACMFAVSECAWSSECGDRCSRKPRPERESGEKEKGEERRTGG